MPCTILYYLPHEARYPLCQSTSRHSVFSAAINLTTSVVDSAHLLNKSSHPPKSNTFAKKNQARLERSIRASTESQIPLSPRGVSAINLQITASHKATRIANAEHSRAPVLLRHTQLAQHVLRRPVAPALGILLEQSLDHGSCDVARRNRVYADAVAAPFRSEVAAELEDGGFGGVVGWADEALVESVRGLL